MHRLDALLLNAPELQRHPRAGNLPEPEGAGDAVEDPSSDEELSTTDGEDTSDDDDSVDPKWCPPNPTVEVSLSQPCFGHFFRPCFRAMMKQVCWHSRRSEAHRGLPEARPRTQNVMARGQSEAHGDSNLYNTRQD